MKTFIFLISFFSLIGYSQAKGYQPKIGCSKKSDFRTIPMQSELLKLVQERIEPRDAVRTEGNNITITDFQNWNDFSEVYVEVNPRHPSGASYTSSYKCKFYLDKSTCKIAKPKKHKEKQAKKEPKKESNNGFFSKLYRMGTKAYSYAKEAHKRVGQIVLSPGTSSCLDTGPSRNQQKSDSTPARENIKQYHHKPATSST